MAIPRKVREAAEKAEALHKQVYAPVEPEATQEPAPAPTDPPQDVLQAPQAPEQPPEPQAQPAAPPAEDKWEHKFKVIEGKYRAEVPRLAAQVRELTQMNASLSAELEELRSRAQNQRTPLITTEDREKYGDDLLEVIQRAAKEVTADKDVEITSLKKTLESITATTARNAEVGFYERIGQLVPDWVLINDDEGFHQWLDEYDVLTGMRRQDLLSAAEEAKDADRVARFFSLWKEQKEQSRVTSQQALAGQAAPDGTRVVSPPAGKRYFTRAEIAGIYAAARRGEITPAQMVAVEAEIHAAAVEGRIR